VGSEEDAPVSSEEEKNMALVRRFWEAQANADILGANPQGGLVDQLPGRSLRLYPRTTSWTLNKDASLREWIC
jgi:hypothetical protein